jgi:hypothetical protein
VVSLPLGLLRRRKPRWLSSSHSATMIRIVGVELVREVLDIERREAAVTLRLQLDALHAVRHELRIGYQEILADVRRACGDKTT